MVSIRKFDVSDLQKIQACNLMSLPENYQMKYYFYHYIAWPSISWVAETSDNKIVGYVLVKMYYLSTFFTETKLLLLFLGKTKIIQKNADILLR